MKKIIYIRGTNIYNDSRATKEIKTFLDRGYKVIVLGWNRSGDSIVKCEQVFRKYKREVQFHFFDLQLVNIGFRNFDKILKWILWGRRNLKKIHSEENIDIIHACDLDCGLIALPFCKKNNLKFVYDIYDYYIDSHNIPNYIEKYVEKMEINVINNASLVIVCTEERVEQISKANAERVVVIYNSPNVSKFNQKKILYDYVYCGSLVDNRLIEEILTEYHYHQDLKILFAGFGKYGEVCRSMSEKYKNFHYVGSITYDKVIELESMSRVISAIYEPSLRNHKFCAPNKFYEAMALSKPVIACFGTGIDKLIKKENIGSLINYSSKEFYEALYYIKENKAMVEEMGYKARGIFDAQYNWSIMERKLLKEYSSLF